jgi:hypothetical protein
LTERGGPEALSALRHAMVRSIAVLTAMIEHLQALWLMGERVDLNGLATLLNTRRREAAAISIDPEPAPGPTVESIAAEYEAAELRRALLDDMTQRTSMLNRRDEAAEAGSMGDSAESTREGDGARSINDSPIKPSTSSKNSDTPESEILSFTDPAEIRRWDRDRGATTSSSKLSADTKTFGNGFSWRRRFDSNTRTAVFDLYDAGGQLCGHRRTDERAGAWCAAGGSVT